MSKAVAIFLLLLSLLWGDMGGILAYISIFSPFQSRFNVRDKQQVQIMPLTSWCFSSSWMVTTTTKEGRKEEKGCFSTTSLSFSQIEMLFMTDLH